MEKQITQRIYPLLRVMLIALLPGALYANALQDGAQNQTQGYEEPNGLSWPIPNLFEPPPQYRSFEPSYKCHKHAYVAQKCLLVGRLDPQNPTVMQSPYAVDLPGERYDCELVSGTERWDYDSPIRQAGFTRQVIIPEEGVVLEGQDPALDSAASKFPLGATKGYVKHFQKRIRVILAWAHTISYSQLHSLPVQGPYAPPNVTVFVSDITPLKQIFEKRMH